MINVADNLRVLLLIGYFAASILFLVAWARLTGGRQLRARTYNWSYFLRLALIGPALTQFGFCVLVSCLYHTPKEASVAVGLSLLVGVFFWMVFVLVLLRVYYRRYMAAANVRHRLARMTPAERSAALSKDEIKLLLAERDRMNDNQT